MEVLLKIREMVLPRARNNFKLQERIREIEQSFSLSESVVSGDFTSRLDVAVRGVIRVTRTSNAVDRRSQLTNIMFEDPIPKLRDAIVSLRDQVEQAVRSALGISFNPGVAALRYEHSMGQGLPDFIHRVSSLVGIEGQSAIAASS